MDRAMPTIHFDYSALQHNMSKLKEEEEENETRL